MSILFKTLRALVIFSSLSTVTAETIKIGVEDLNYLPYYRQVNGEYQGYARQVFDLFGKRYNHDIKYVIYPIIRLNDALVDGAVDFKFPDNPNWIKGSKIGSNFYYSDSVCEYIDGVLEKENKTDKLDKTIGIMRGFTPWGLKNDLSLGKISILEHSVFEGMLKKVLTGRIDGAYINIYVGSHIQRTNSELSQMGSLVFNPSMGYKKGNYHLSTIRRKDLLDQFNEFLKEERDIIDALKKKYKLDATSFLL